MGNWRYRIDIAKEWRELEPASEGSEMFSSAKFDAFVKRLESYENMPSGYFYHTAQIKTASTIDEFDSAWDAFYDFADENRIWINILS